MLKKPIILFVVAHPDDEVLWIGGMLHSMMNIMNVHLICLSGGEDDDRSRDFCDVMKVLDKVNYVHLGGKLGRQREGGLPNVTSTTIDGLQKLNIKISDIDLLVTHSPYGDEHRHIHHIQTYNELSNFAATNAIPFGFFSYMMIPYFKMVPEISVAKRGFGLHLVNFMSCEPYKPTKIQTPKYFVQFKVSDIKHDMLNLYKSVNREEHKQGYYAWDSLVEGLYLTDERSLQPIKRFIKLMSTPNGDPKLMQGIRK